MATKTGVYNDKIKSIMGNDNANYLQSQMFANIDTSREVLETELDRDDLFQKAMLKSTLKQEEYLKKIEKHTKHEAGGMLGRIGRIAEFAEKAWGAFNLFKEVKEFMRTGRSGKENFGHKGLSQSCCCDGMGNRGGMGSSRGSGGRNRNRRGGTYRDDVDRVRGTGEGLGTGYGGSRSERARAERVTRANAKAFATQSGQMAKQWGKGMIGTMDGMFKSTTGEFRKSASEIRKITSVRGKLFTKEAVLGVGGVLAGLTGILGKKGIGAAFKGVKLGGRALVDGGKLLAGGAAATGVFGKMSHLVSKGFFVVNALLSGLDFLDGYKNAGQMAGVKNPRFGTKVRMGATNAADSFAFGLPSMATNALGLGDFGKAMNDMHNSRAGRILDTFNPAQMGLDSIDDLSLMYRKWKGDPAAMKQQSQMQKRLSAFGIGGNNPASAAKNPYNEISMNGTADSVMATTGKASLSGSYYDQVKSFNEQLKIQEPLREDVDRVRKAIQLQTTTLVETSTKNSKDEQGRSKAVMDNIKKYLAWKNGTPAPAAIEAGAAEAYPTGAGRGTNNSFGQTPNPTGTAVNERTGQSDSTRTANAISQGSSAASMLQRPGSAADSVPFQSGTLPSGFSGTSQSPKTTLAATARPIGSGSGNRSHRDEVMDAMIKHGASPKFAAAVAGNMSAESGFSTTIYGDKNRPGGSTGMMQWDAHRMGNLKKFAAENGLAWDSREAQGRFAIEESIAGSKYADAGSVAARKLIDGDSKMTPGQAAVHFAQLSERPADWALQQSAGKRAGGAEDASKNYSPAGVQNFASLAGSLDGRGTSIALPNAGQGGAVTAMKSPMDGVDINNLTQVPRSGGSKDSRSFGGPRGKGVHAGVDIPSPEGTPIKAIADGVIRRITGSGTSGYGNVVDIEYPDGTVHRNAHLQGFANGLQVGSKVKAGQVIGAVGHTGNADAGFTHDHYEVFKKDYYDANDKTGTGAKVNGRSTEGRIDPREYFAKFGGGDNTLAGDLAPSKVATTKVAAFTDQAKQSGGFGTTLGSMFGTSPAFAGDSFLTRSTPKGDRVGNGAFSGGTGVRTKDDRVGSGDFGMPNTGKGGRVGSGAFSGNFDDRINSAFGTSTSMTGKVQRPDPSLASVPSPDQSFVTQGNDIQNSMKVAPSAPASANVPPLGGIPNNADLTELMPLLYDKAMN